MTRSHKLTAWTLASMIALSAASGGCNLNPLALIGKFNNINLVIPLGLDGNNGILQLLGILPTMINNMVGGNTNVGDGNNQSPPPPVL